MVVKPKIAASVLVGAALVVAGCGSAGSSPDVPASSSHNAQVGLGAAPSSATSPSVSVVQAANFQSPSKNITCDLTVGAVRCEIVNRQWEPPPSPASCRLAWGHSMSIENGKAAFVCAGDTVIGTATRVLPYGSSLRAGSVQCDSGDAALRCFDVKTQSGFTLAVADYDLF